MTNDISPAEQFDDAIKLVRRTPPKVGLAALTGKTRNDHLRRSWQALQDVGVTMQRGTMDYRWRSIHDANPKLGQSIEEVLAFGDALFSAWAKKQAPENLSQEYLDLKQRFSKIIKETELLAVAPKGEKKLFSFFEKPQDPKMDERLDQLDTLLEQAHDRSRTLLHKTETDLLQERAFHRAAEWYVLALNTAQAKVSGLSAPANGRAVDADVVSDLQTALVTSAGTTSAILGQTDRLLRVKEALHNKSILFLTAHENTFTVIQGHLRSWKDIKLQTEAINSLSQTVKVGMTLMSSAASELDTPIKQWDPSFVTPETIQKLSQSFEVYDEEVSALVDSLTPKSPDNTPRFSRWDDWATTKKELVDPLLAAAHEASSPIASGEMRRPVLRAKAAPVAQPSPIAEATEEGFTNVRQTSPTPHPRLRKWSVLDEIVVAQSLELYNATFQTNWTSAHASGLGWSAADTVARLMRPQQAWEILQNEDFELCPAVVSHINHEVRYGSNDTPWADIMTQSVLSPVTANWSADFASWMSKLDDVDWAYMMQWNDVVADLLILEHDPAQKSAVLNASDTDHAAIRAGLISRIADLVADPGVPDASLKTWGMAGLVTRYAIALDMGTPAVSSLWRLWHNPKSPIDWDQSEVSEWPAQHPSDLSTPTGQAVWGDPQLAGQMSAEPSAHRVSGPMLTPALPAAVSTRRTKKSASTPSKTSRTAP